MSKIGKYIVVTTYFDEDENGLRDVGVVEHEYEDNAVQDYLRQLKLMGDVPVHIVSVKLAEVTWDSGKQVKK